MLRKYEWNVQEVWDIIKRPNLQIMGIEGEEIQTNSIDSLFNNMTAGNFPNLEKGRDIQFQEVYRTPNHQDQKRNTPDIS
jgi:hypothetical protein